LLLFCLWLLFLSFLLWLRILILRLTVLFLNVKDFSKEVVETLKTSLQVQISVKWISALLSCAPSSSKKGFERVRRLLSRASLALAVDVSERLGILLPMLIKAEGSSCDWLSKPDHRMISIVSLLTFLAQVVVLLNERLVPDSLNRTNFAGITSDSLMNNLADWFDLFSMSA